jgi:transglutaminase-like putative cysteine protease
MTARLLVFLFAITFAPLASSQSLPAAAGEPFAVSAIPPGFAGDAPAVVRLYDRSVSVRNDRQVVERVKRVVTVLTNSGRSYGEQAIFYDGFSRIRSFSGQVRDANGRVVRRLGRNDFGDFAGSDGFSLYTDLRVRRAELYHDVLPYTIEFEYEVHHTSTLHLPTWYPQSSSAPVVYARFSVETPVDLSLRHESFVDIQPVTQTASGRTTHRWEASMLPLRRSEPRGPSWIEQAGGVLVAIDQFHVGGSRGSMATWAEFASWYHSLGAGRQQLPPATRQEVARLVADARDEREKVARLYRYLQDKTRYVSIQLGLGGWQPFDAMYVDQRSYGDCKALTNYLLALLTEAGIRAYPALIRSGRNVPDLRPGFPSSQFNHVILFVPLADGELWLEATDRLAPFGHIGSANEDRFALVVRPDGGELRRTPLSEASRNVQARRATVELTPAGAATVRVETRYSGNQQGRVRQALTNVSGRDRANWLRDEVSLPAFDIVSADYGSIEQREDELRLPVELAVRNYGTVAGPRLIFNPNLMERATQVLPPLEKRTQPVQHSYLFVDVDSIRYVVPPGFGVEALPQPVRLEHSFGTFSADIMREEDGTLLYVRRLEVRERIVPADAYETYRSFFSGVVQADRSQVVLVRQ